MLPSMTIAYHNVFSSSAMPVWFNNTNFLRASVSFGLAGTGDVTSTVEQTSGVWNFYAVTTTATTTKVYVNGVLVSSGNIPWAGDTAEINFGAYARQSPYTGRLDDMRLYSQTLSADEISRIYTNTLL
jgi:hypothetical protein